MYKFAKTKTVDLTLAYYNSDFSDYYFNGHKPQWGGNLKNKLIPFNRRDSASKVDFSSLLRNRSPLDAMQKLRSNSKIQCYEFCCSAPKSISILAALCAQRKDFTIHEIHSAAVKETFDKIIAPLANTRVRKNKANYLRNTGDIIYLTVEHDIARPSMGKDGKIIGGDPDLHEHIIMPNLTYDKVEKKYKAVNPKAMTQILPLATEVYRNILVGTGID